jgi:hypothetical protein
MQSTDGMIEEAKRRVQNAGAAFTARFEGKDLMQLAFSAASFSHAFSGGMGMESSNLEARSCSRSAMSVPLITL